jgi:hypothetical protein
MQPIQATSRMAALAGESGQALTHRAIEAFDEGGIEHRAAL